LQTLKLLPHCPLKYGFDVMSPPSVPALNLKDGHFLVSFDQRLWMFHRCWEPPLGVKVHATLMIVHGTVDHSGAYAELAQKLANVGVAVFAMDMRGWGLSDGESMYIDHMDTFVADVDALYQHVHALPPYKSIKSRFLMGKSLGGTVTAFCVAKHPKHWTGILGLSGAYQIDPKLLPSPIVLFLLRGLARLFPKLPLKPLFDEHLIVADEQALQAWREDPLCSKDKLRLGYIVTFFDALKKLLNGIVPQIDIPMLMMCGDADKVVTLSGHKLMIRASRHADKQLKVYPHGYHNLLQEPSLKLQVMADIQEWILSHTTHD
jgi:acylglycerol lipase